MINRGWMRRNASNGFMFRSLSDEQNYRATEPVVIMPAADFDALITDAKALVATGTLSAERKLRETIRRVTAQKGV